MTENPGSGARAVVVGLTDVGRVREHNEDSFLVMNRGDGRRAGNKERYETQLDGALLLVVCDGMGGAAAGEIASRMAADRMAAELGKADFVNSTPDQIASVMDHAVQQANVDIHEAAKQNPSQKGMGTTMTAAVVTPGRLFVSQVGDSRAYLLRKGNLNQITKDQSLIGQLIEEGTLTEEEAEKLGGRNIVLQAVGVEENLRVDTKYWPVLRGDVLLVCSDGLSGMVKDARMKEILIEAGDDMVAAAERLVAEANENGGRDNVTSIVARFDGDGLRPPMEAAGEGEIEKAGVAFKAPPPPEVENPMRRMTWVGVALLAVIASLFFVLRKTTADVQITTKLAGLPVRVVLKSEEGKTYEAVLTNGTALIKDVEPSDKPFELIASAENHEDDHKAVAIPDPGQAQLTAWPVPKRGTVSVESATPRVNVRILAPGSHEKVSPYDQRWDLPEAGQKREFAGIPAGPVTVTAEREGFRAKSVEKALEPTGSVHFEIPALEQVTSHISIDCEENGAKILVFDQHGEQIAEDEVRDKTARVKVRVGRHAVRVTKRGFYEFSATDVLVEEGKVTPLTVTLKVQMCNVTITGPKNATYKILKLLNNAEPAKADEGTLGEAGRSRLLALVPANYEIHWEVEGQVQAPVALEIPVGEQTRSVQLR